ncbi:MAG: nuclear transport factor 2 family protein [Thermoanaerobaculia bacterium]|nr:nuclear transport factor 2 family protein [Thermoanaerobaculia bacterium]
MRIRNGLHLALAVAVVLGLAGCASTGGGGGPSDEEVIQGMLDDVLAALQAKDIDAMISTYADDFTSDNGGKEDTKAFLQGAADQGFLDGIEVDQSETAVAVDGDTASVGPVGLEGAFGALSLTFNLEKRDGQWWVTSMSQQM